MRHTSMHLKWHRIKLANLDRIVEFSKLFYLFMLWLSHRLSDTIMHLSKTICHKKKHTISTHLNSRLFWAFIFSLSLSTKYPNVPQKKRTHINEHFETVMRFDSNMIFFTIDWLICCHSTIMQLTFFTHVKQINSFNFLLLHTDVSFNL